MDSGPHPWVSNPVPEAGEEEAPSVPWPRLTCASLAKSHCFPKLWPVEPHTETFVPPGRLVLACEAPRLVRSLGYWSSPPGQDFDLSGGSETYSQIFF